MSRLKFMKEKGKKKKRGTEGGGKGVWKSFERGRRKKKKRRPQERTRKKKGSLFRTCQSRTFASAVEKKKKEGKKKERRKKNLKGERGGEGEKSACSIRCSLFRPARLLTLWGKERKRGEEGTGGNWVSNLINKDKP